jgi:histidinol-phosphate phosphatase family protein
MTGEALSYDVVVPTVGRPSLGRLLDALASQHGPAPGQVIVVDDRRDARESLLAGPRDDAGAEAAPRADQRPLAARLRLLDGGGRGPAAARNLGWRASEAPWIVFLDDDVVPSPAWSEALAADLGALGPQTAGSQGTVRVPLPGERKPTDWERNVSGLEGARYASADIAYRRAALEQVGGFDERFGRAYREDSDLALRVRGLGLAIAQGRRLVEHPPGPASLWRSVSLQRGNADDALMRRLHGRDWRRRAGAPSGRLPMHMATAAAAVGALGLAGAGRPRASALAATLSAAGIGELAFRRIAPGPRTAREIATMLATSAVIPFAASAHRLRGELRWRRARPLAPAPPAAVLFDRDGTLIEDVPYNGDPALVRPRPGAREALQALRAAGVPVAVISNQSGVARGLISEEQVRAVNRRAEQVLGTIDAWLYCPHGPGEGCACRKPAPGLVLRAAQELGVRPESCAVVGDIEADVRAALAAGARAVLVPNGATRSEEIATAPLSAPDLPSAVQLLIGGRR